MSNNFESRIEQFLSACIHSDEIENLPNPICVAEEYIKDVAIKIKSMDDSHINKLENVRENEVLVSDTNGEIKTSGISRNMLGSAVAREIAGKNVRKDDVASIITRLLITQYGQSNIIPDKVRYDSTFVHPSTYTVGAPSAGVAFGDGASKNSTVAVTDMEGNPVKLYGIPVESGGNIIIDGQQYISDVLTDNGDGTGTVSRKFKSYTITGQESMEKYLDYTFIVAISVPGLNAVINPSDTTAMCDRFAGKSLDYMTSVGKINSAGLHMYGYGYFVHCSGDTVYIRLGDTSPTNVKTDLINYYNQNKRATIYYLTATPTTEIVNISGVANTYYPTTTMTSDAYTVVSYNRTLDDVVTKLPGATENNILIVGADGALKNSGIPITNVITTLASFADIRAVCKAGTAALYLSEGEQVSDNDIVFDVWAVSDRRVRLQVHRSIGSLFSAYVEESVVNIFEVQRDIEPGSTVEIYYIDSSYSRFVSSVLITAAGYYDSLEVTSYGELLNDNGETWVGVDESGENVLVESNIDVLSSIYYDGGYYFNNEEITAGTYTIEEFLDKVVYTGDTLEAINELEDYRYEYIEPDDYAPTIAAFRNARSDDFKENVGDAYIPDAADFEGGQLPLPFPCADEYAINLNGEMFTNYDYYVEMHYVYGGTIGHKQIYTSPEQFSIAPCFDITE